LPIEDPITGRVWLTTREAAAYLGKSLRWLRNQLEERRITVHKRGGTNMFLLSELEEYERANTRPAGHNRTPAQRASIRRRRAA
jgi:excisionase family DNA binding protein